METNLQNKKELVTLPPKKGNYWPLIDRNKDTFLRFPYINSNRNFDVYPYELEDIDVIKKQQDDHLIIKRGKMLRILTSETRGDKPRLWLIIHLPEFFNHVSFMIEPNSPQDKIKNYKRLDILQYIYFLYTQPEELVNFNTEMLLKQYIRTSDFVVRSILAHILFSIIKQNMPKLQFATTIFSEINYDKVIQARTISVESLITRPKKSKSNKVESEVNKDPRNIMEIEEAKGIKSLFNVTETMIRLYQKDLFNFVYRTLQDLINQIFGQEVPLSRFNMVLEWTLPLIPGAKSNNIYSVIVEFHRLFNTDYYYFEDFDARNILNLFSDLCTWNMFLRIFQIMDEYLNHITPISNIQPRDFFMPISKNFSLTLNEIKGTPYKDTSKFILSASSKKRIVAILNTAISNYIQALANPMNLQIFLDITQKFVKSKKSGDQGINSGLDDLLLKHNSNLVNKMVEAENKDPKVD